eukprot:GHVN01064249.1.p1 GENE.GHVN01064249.1~~GHVN01064249.1.p1  ORF type:complete len:285 (+),score=18.39 GHVN01064249.1:50-904(+)
MACLCCIVPFASVQVATTALVVYLSHFLIPTRYPLTKTASRWITLTFAMALLALTILLVFLSAFPHLQSYCFSKLYAFTSNSGSLDVYRSMVVNEAHGVTLEIGPGPGTSFRSFKEDIAITSYTGVEPNEHFGNMFEAEAKAQGIKFPVKMLWGDSYESLETGTFDTVISTHVLCSVDEVESMLETIGRLLKPGGQFVFLEHVAAKKGTLQRSFQRLIGPVFKIIAAGCEFRDLQQTLEDGFSAVQDGKPQFSVEVEHFSAPMPFPFKPHVKGSVKKLHFRTVS